MKFLSKLVILVFAYISVAQGATWVGWHKIKLVHPYSTGHFFVQLNAAHVNPDGCANASWYVLSPETKGYDTIVKTALSAKAADQNFRIYINGCQNNQTKGGYPVIHHVMAW